MTDVEFRAGNLTPEEQAIVAAGFTRQASALSTPPFEKQPLTWVVHKEQSIVGVLSAELLWDWMYIDKLWIDESHRGQGLGKSLMAYAEDYAASRQLVGLWLWTQSWQAADFYKKIGYQEFARFENFPQGYSRIGLRKQLVARDP